MLSDEQSALCVQRLTYASEDGTWDGILSPVTSQLAELVEATDLHYQERRWPSRAVLWFRRGTFRILRVSVVRRMGRCIVEFAGLEPRTVLAAMCLCRDHFDRSFGVVGEDLGGPGEDIGADSPDDRSGGPAEG